MKSLKHNISPLLISYELDLMKLKFSYAFILSTILISGCAGKVALMKNQEGDVAKCEVSAGEAMLTGVIVRDMTIDNCVEEYEKAGYKKI